MNRYVVVPHHGESRFRLARHGRIVLFTTAEGPAGAALTGWSRLFGDRATAEILQELERVTSDNPALDAFVLAVLDDDAVEIAVNGGLPVAAHGPTGIDVIQSGNGVLHRRLTDVSIIGVTVQGAVVDPLLELERGTIAADGFEIRITRPSASGSPWAPPTAPAPSAPQMPADDTGASPRPAPSEVAEATTAVPVDDGVRVQGLRCERGHFNDPRALACAVCGVGLHQASFVLVEDVRPPLGVLVFSDGARQTLASTSVVGRDPGDDAAVRAGNAVPLPLADPTNTLSRVHAELRLVDWDVQLVDRGSTNGTFVWASGQTAWERLAPDSPRTLQPGTHVSFGRMTATLESAPREG